MSARAQDAVALVELAVEKERSLYDVADELEVDVGGLQRLRTELVDQGVVSKEAGLEHRRDLERAERAWELHDAGADWNQIAPELGFNRASTASAFARRLSDRPPKQRQKHDKAAT